jgi:hypothetical protein
LDQREVSEEASTACEGNKFATGSFFGLFGADGAPAAGFDDVGAANLRAFCDLPPFISRSLSM